jgi:DNA-binding CsgD family transcriptional regulator
VALGMPGIKKSASWDLDAVSAAFAEAAVDPSRWDAAMESIARHTGSFGAVCFSVRSNTPSIPMSESMEPGMDAYFRDGWHLRDERRRTIPVMVGNGIADDFDWIGPDEMNRHAFFRDFLVRFGLKYFGLIKMAADGELWGVSVQRSPEQGPLSERQKRQLAKLSAQLGTAAAVARALGFARAEAALGAFEVSGSAVVLLDQSAQVLRANAAAERLLTGDPRIERRRVVSNNREATAALDRALHAILWNSSTTALAAPVLLPRFEKRPVLAYPLRLAAISADALAACQAVLVLVDMEDRPRPPASVLQSTFKLSPAEANLAMLLASGDPVETVADTLRVAKNTARTQLKAVFAKTQTHRQAELVALLASFLGHQGRGLPT